jgi:Spy/CpxP family protein refolding chaperone
VNFWKVILATMVIFGAGVITGALVSQFSLNPSLMHPPRQGRPAEMWSPGGMRFEFLRRTQRELNLTTEQRERVDKILKQSQERTRKLMEPMAPQLHQELQRAKAEFREVLTSEQQTHFDELLKQQQRFREQHRWPNKSEPVSTNTVLTNSI